jgi:hypothetical protein
LAAKFLKGIAFDWIVALIEIIRLFLAWLKKFCRPKLPHSETNTTNTECAIIDHPAFHRPDPLIYSQSYLSSLGLAVTWDNPDIALFENGVQVSEGDLQPNTTYEIRATIWNNSYDAPIAGLRVDFSFLTFGVTTVSTPIGTTAIDLGVKGGAQHPAIARIAWTTPPAGHYCIVVSFNWVDDANPANNVGQNNVNVVAATSPAIFTFRIRNAEQKPRNYRMEADTYTLPAPDECAARPPKPSESRKRWAQLQQRHNRSMFPVPPGWSVEFAPPMADLLPGEEVDVTVTITPPAQFTGRKAFNINAIMAHGVHAGGVSVYVTKA